MRIAFDGLDEWVRLRPGLVRSPPSVRSALPGSASAGNLDDGSGRIDTYTRSRLFPGRTGKSGEIGVE